MFPYSYIAFHDLSRKAHFLWVSPTVEYVLGYTPEELIGTCSYDYVLPEDTTLTASVHREVAMHELVAGQVTLRFRAKNGNIVLVNLILNYCYDIGITCGTLLGVNPGEYLQSGIQSHAMSYTMRARQKEFERIKRHHRAFADNSELWDSNGLDPEPRVCMILNRFSRDLVIMYASQACEIIFDIKPENLEGKPILLFIRADEMGSFVENVDTSKSSGTIMHIRFWFQTPKSRCSLPCEAVLIGTSDGILAIMKECKPFVRRHLIHNSQYYNHYRQHTHATQGNSYSSSQSTASSSSSYTSSVSSEGYLSTSASSLSQSNLKHIKILDRNEGKVRPLEEFVQADPSCSQHDANLTTEKLGIREYRRQEYVENDSDDEEEPDTAYVRSGLRRL